MERVRILGFFLMSLISMAGSAQSFFFEKRLDVPVNDSLGNPLKHPWIGGFNACIMGEIDLNFDGKNDLVVFDQHAGKIFTFLNFGEKGQVDYRYAPQYEACFPEFSTCCPKFTMWIQLIDFNGDGLPDLFVSSYPSYISVYKNVSQNSTVKFELYIPRLTAQIEGVEHYLFCNEVDFPSFVDVDGDGDLDLLNFYIPSAGNTLYYYKNHSMERYGHADSLIFILEDSQWGCFEESSESNQIVLDVCESDRHPERSEGPAYKQFPHVVQDDTPVQEDDYSLNSTPARKHTGGTVFAIDLNNDSLYDLLMADFGYPNMVALYNGGTREKAKITHIDTAFPSGSTPVNVLNCPAISEIDIDNDGVKELIFSPFSGTDFSTNAYEANWVYKNMSTTNIADYQLISKRFLQDEMLDFGMGAYPTIVDIDGNGLLDIVVGNYGVVDSAWEELGAWQSQFVSDLVILKNVGTPTEPRFEIHPLNLTPRLSVSAAVPTFGDLHNDGNLDLFIGTETGEILHYRNQNPPHIFPPNFVLENPNILQENLGTFLAPQLVDLNNDGLLDLVVGEKQTIWRDAQNRAYFKGNINYLQNVGTKENPEFMLITDSLGRVDATNRDRSNFGYSKPHFFRDAAGNTHLFCGNEDGKVLHYVDIDDNLSGTFRQLNDVMYTINDRISTLSEGSFTAIAVADLNNDGFLDLVVGNHRGGLTLFYGIPTTPLSSADILEEVKITLYPNPVHDWLFIQAEENWPMQCEIFDLQGRVVRPLQSVGNGQGIDVQSLSSGSYILKVMQKGRACSIKFVKM